MSDSMKYWLISGRIFSIRYRPWPITGKFRLIACRVCSWSDMPSRNTGPKSTIDHKIGGQSSAKPPTVAKTASESE
jgi:hypothetical protein